jgi:hypothetical protein
MTLKLAPRATSRFDFVAALPVIEMVAVGMADALELVLVEEREVEGERNEWTPVPVPVPAGVEIAGIEIEKDGIETEKDGIGMLDTDSEEDCAPLPLGGVRSEGCMDLIDVERGLKYISL